MQKLEEEDEELIKSIFSNVCFLHLIASSRVLHSAMRFMISFLSWPNAWKYHRVLEILCGGSMMRTWMMMMILIFQ